MNLIILNLRKKYFFKFVKYCTIFENHKYIFKNIFLYLLFNEKNFKNAKLR